jgi:tRNA dimethylallyltransferase
VELLVLGGPTAAGKTRLALELACRHGAALVSADAMMVYRGFDVGTAKPSARVLRRFPHGAVDVVEADEEFSVVDFTAAVAAARAAHPRVLVVGGTPFYLQALLQPLAPLPPADPALRARLEALPDLHARLAAVDPAAAARLHPHDRVRLVRALEVHALTGERQSDLHGRTPPPAADVVLAWLDRDDLRPRIAARLAAMRGQGYLDEVRRLRAAGVADDSRPMRSFGYRHLVEHLRGALGEEEAFRRTERDTWTFARKQRAWARSRGWDAVSPADVRARARALWGPGR